MQITLFFLQYGRNKLQVCEVLDLSMTDFKPDEYLSGAYLGVHLEPSQTSTLFCKNSLWL